MGTQKTPKPKMPVLGVQLFCPLSGFKKADGSIIPPHRMMARPCANGTLFAFCQNHVFRCFSASVETVQMVTAASEAAQAQPKETP